MRQPLCLRNVLSLIRITSYNVCYTKLLRGDTELERQLRPLSFADFKGQPRITDNLTVFVTAALQRGEALDHVLLHGPPGLGKTTLAIV